MIEASASMYAVTGDTIDYEPRPEESLAARSQAEGRPVDELAYDALMAREGNGFVLLALMNYAFGNYDHVTEMLESEATVVSLSDGGAHVGTICDASIPTFMLTHWARDRTRGPRLSLEEAVRRQTSHTANYYGLGDRGVLAPGYLADVNIIDFDRLKLERPYLTFDLPAGGKRYMQRAQGYAATIKTGVVVSREGAFTGDLPGRLVRGRRMAPGRVAESLAEGVS
jgi:N-acyl-D-aspartate/D-glutamate deacylase